MHARCNDEFGNLVDCFRYEKCHFVALYRAVAKHLKIF